MVRRGRLTQGTVVAIAAYVAVLGGDAALAATGDLTYGGCISGETASAACTASPFASATGENSGLDFAHPVITSADGASVYAVSLADDAVTHFQRDLVTGVLSYAGCVSAETQSATACMQIAGAASNGADTGMDEPQHVALAPDGRFLYVASRGDTAVTRFSRNPATGALTFADCVSAETQTAGKCAQLPTTLSMGANSGLDNPEALAISSDGRNLYVLAQGDDGVATFEIASDGALAYRGCLSAETPVSNCTQLPGATMNGQNTGLASLQSMAVSADAKSLYTVDDSDDAVAHFDRDPQTGMLTFVRCLSADSLVTACDPVPGATPMASDTGLDSLVHVLTSPDGSSVFAVGDGDESLLTYRRDPDSGAISFQNCHTASLGPSLCAAIPTATSGGSNSGMDFSRWSAVAPDARSVYVVSGIDDGLTHFARDPRTGVLTWSGCLSAETESSTACSQVAGAVSTGANTGLDQPSSLAASPDGRSMYLTTGLDDSVATFARTPDDQGPKLKLKPAGGGNGRALAAKGGRKVVLKVTCKDEFCADLTVRGVVIGDGKRAKLKQASKRAVQAGDPERMSLKLSGKAKRLIRGATEATLVAKAVAHDLLGNRGSERKRLSL